MSCPTEGGFLEASQSVPSRGGGVGSRVVGSRKKEWGGVFFSQTKRNEHSGSPETRLEWRSMVPVFLGEMALDKAE